MNLTKLQEAAYKSIMESTIQIPDVASELMKVHVSVTEALMTHEAGEDVASEIADAIISLIGVSRLMHINIEETIACKLGIAASCAASESAEHEFLNSRTAFVFNGDAFLVQLPDDHRHSKEWIRSLNLDDLDYDKAIRGHIRNGVVGFCVGEDYRPVKNLPTRFVDTVSRQHMELYGYAPRYIYNGFHVGKIGETWKPVEVLYDINAPVASTR